MHQPFMGAMTMSNAALFERYSARMLGQQVQQALVTHAPEMHSQGAPSTAVQHERCSATCRYLVLHTAICNIAETIKRMYKACETMYQEQGISMIH